MSLAQQFLLNCLEFRAHAVASGFPLEEEPAPARFSADQREAKKGESLRSSQASPSAIDRRVAAELDQAGLFRMQRQRELPQPFAHFFPEATSVSLALKADDYVVSISHHDHIAPGLASSPTIRPEIKDVVKVDVSQ